MDSCCNQPITPPTQVLGRRCSKTSQQRFLVVILQPQMRNQLLALEVAQRVLQLHGLDEQVVLGIQPRRRHRRLEVEAQPLLDADASQLRRALRQVEEQHQVEHNGRGKDGVAAEEIDLDLHRITEPAEDIYIVPTLFVITAWRIIVNADLVADVPVKFGIKFGLENVLQYRQLRFFLGLERA